MQDARHGPVAFRIIGVERERSLSRIVGRERDLVGAEQESLAR